MSAGALVPQQYCGPHISLPNSNSIILANSSSRIVGTTKAPFGRTRTILMAAPGGVTSSSVTSSAAPVAKPNLRPIKVDNWGIFLLTRLQNYFQKKELCDLTIRFPLRNAQIKARLRIRIPSDKFFSSRYKLIRHRYLLF
jgi:hypothetical protein